MGADVAGLFIVFILVRTVYAEALFLVDVGPPHGDGDGEDGYIHHDQVGYLNSCVKAGQVDDLEACSSGRSRLE